ncbi:MAG: ferritin family protein [Deferrisomatales bacterium]|nr:ferritin family protein [Deferrisomatales bacterium]
MDTDEEESPMETGTALDILKSALLLERRGKAFYTAAAEQAKSRPVRELFERMAEEEERHIGVLSDQFASYRTRGAFAAPPADRDPSGDVAAAVLTRRLSESISAASFEAAAVSAAMALERNAIRLYADRAQSAQDPEERALYQWLADWEAGHLELLSKVDREVTEAAWNDNAFWPY